MSLCLCASVAFAQAPPLTVERIASYPNLSGTPPSRPVWSRDSSRLAFLWNDQGWPFRDIWVVRVTDVLPMRVTNLRRVPDLRRTERDVPADVAQQAALRGDEGVSEVVWTPDGQALIFSYHGDLFRVNADSSGLTPLTQSHAGASALAFSPDGQTLSYLSGGDLWFFDLAGGKPVKITHYGVAPIGAIPGGRFSDRDVQFSSYKWSPTGRHVALYFEDRRQVRKILIPDYLGSETHFTTIRRDFPGDRDLVRMMAIVSVPDGHLRFIDLAGKTDRRIAAYDWSPDGSRLLVDQYSEDAIHRWIYLVAPEDGSIRELWHDARDTRVSYLWTSAWQIDGQGIFFVSDFEGRHRLYGLPLAGSKPVLLTPGDYSVVGESAAAILNVSPATKELFFISTQKNPQERQVYRIRESGGAVTPVTTSPGIHFPFLAPNGEVMAVLRSDDVTPTELYLVDAYSGGAERRVTHSPLKEFYAYHWIQPRYVTFKSVTDGATLHGRLLEPPNLDRTKKYPVILGPVYSNTVRNRWIDGEEWRGLYSILQQYLALEGRYIGFHVDVRGSVGHGREFREGLLMDFGGIDVEDLYSGVQFLKTLPYVDPDRIGIWGSSYGGLMTTMSLFKKPGVYKAGVAGAPATSLWHATTGEVRVARMPAEHPDAYRKMSVISYGEKLQDHLLIVHGMQDDIVLFKDSVTLAEKLLLLGKQFDFAFVPTSAHNWSRKDYYAKYLLEKLVAHFDRYLGRGPR